MIYSENVVIPAIDDCVDLYNLLGLRITGVFFQWNPSGRLETWKQRLLLNLILPLQKYSPSPNVSLQWK